MSAVKIKNAEELLLLCARRNINEALKDKALDLIRLGVNWEYFYELAIKGNVSALAYQVLRKMAPLSAIPQFIIDKFKCTYLFTAAKAIRQHRELLKLLKLFNQNNIEVIPLKGTILANRLYSDIAARGASTDFDLFVKEKDTDRVKSFLKESGYIFIASKLQNRLGDYEFIKPRGTTLDIHCSIMTHLDCSKQRLEGFLKAKRLVQEENVCYYEFEEEELLLYLSLHLVYSDCLRQLRYLCDINELLNKDEDKINWQRLTTKAKDWKLSGNLFLTLKLSKDLFVSPVPDEALIKLRPNFLNRIVIKTLAQKNTILRATPLMRKFMAGFMVCRLYRLVEARFFREYYSVFFPPRQYTKTRGFFPRIFKGILQLIH